MWAPVPRRRATVAPAVMRCVNLSGMQKSPPASGAAAAEWPTVPQYPIESVDNALRLLLLLGERSEIRLTEASQYLGVASSTAHRLFAMLQYRGFVRQDPRSRVYGPGPALTGVAFAVLGRMDIHRLARPVLQELSVSLGETIHLGVLEGTMVRFLDAIESTRAVRVASRLGRSLPAHATSTGKAILADLTLEELRRLYPDEELAQVTSKSLSRRVDLERQLDRVRRLGYATNREESEEGVASVAVSIPSQAPGLRLAVNASAPVGRLPSAKVKEFGATLLHAARTLGEQLG
jgi:DNA-binding IclR family transcriptional regulator